MGTTNIEKEYMEKVLKKLPEPIVQLLLIGNYIENILGERPVSALKYVIYYRTIFKKTIMLSNAIELMLSYDNIWHPSKRKGYFYIKQEYKLPDDLVKKHIRVTGKEEIEYYKILWETFSNNTLAYFIYLLQNKNVQKGDKEFKEFVNRLKKLGLIESRKGSYVLTKKGYKLVIALRTVLELLNENQLLMEFKI